MADPTRLFRYLADAWDKRASSDNPNYELMKAIAEGTEGARDAILDFIADQTIALADDDGLTRLGMLYDLERPPWMGDTQFRELLGAWVSMPMCTLQKIKRLFDIYTSQTCTIDDIITNGAIPAGEIWITLPADYPNLKGRWFAPGLGTTVRSRRPVSSGIAGEIYANSGKWGGSFNDHCQGVDSYLQNLLNRAKAAGTTIKYI